MPFDIVNASIAPYKPLIELMPEPEVDCCQTPEKQPKLKSTKSFVPPPPPPLAAAACIKQEEEEERSEDDIADIVHDAVPVVAGVFVLGLTTGLCVAYFLKRN